MLPANFPYRKESKRKEAAERQEAFNALSVTERLQLLDKRLGVGVGATKQRARLQKFFNKPVEVPVPSAVEVRQVLEQAVEEIAVNKKRKNSEKKRRPKSSE